MRDQLAAVAADTDGATDGAYTLAQFDSGRAPIEQRLSKSRATGTLHNLTRYSFKTSHRGTNDGASPIALFIANIEVSYVLL